jgi:hypothetical protein
MSQVPKTFCTQLSAIPSEKKQHDEKMNAEALQIT